MSDFSLLCGFELIFGNEKKGPKEQYLQGVERGLLLKFASYLLGLDPSTSRLNKWQELVRMWFRPANQQVADLVWKRCEGLEHQYGEISLLSIVASLKMFEFVFESEPQYLEVDEVTSERNLFKLYLIFVDEVTKHEEASKAYIAQKEGKERVAATLLNQTYPYSDVQNYNLRDIFVCQLIKAYYLFEFLQAGAGTQSLLESFRTRFGLDAVSEYFQHFSLIYKGHLEHPSEGWVEFNVPQNEHFVQNCQFLDAISLTDFDTELDADFKELRGNPIYKTAEGTYSIISPLFTTEKIYKGMYFKLNELNKSLAEASRIKNFRSFYTTHFSENVLLYRVLEYIFSGRSYKQFSGSQMAEMAVGLPDYYIRNGKYLFLFENKDIFINAEVKQSWNYVRLEAEFKKKLYFEQKEEKIEWKGVFQLAQNVKKALLNQNAFDNQYKAKSLWIYPILVLHDSSFSALGFNYVIDSWFQIELKKIEAEGLDISRVRPLTVIFIDTLILYADFLKLKKVSLEDLLEAYAKHSIFNDKKTYKSKQDLESAYADSLYPFSLFIHRFTKNGYNRVPFTLLDRLLPKLLS
jgi:hypothetical protein